MKTLLRIFVGVFAVVGLLTISGIGLGIWAVKSQVTAAQPKTPEKIVLVIDFSQPLTERTEFVPTSLHALIDTMTSEGQLSLHDVVYALEHGSSDPHVLGVVGLFGENMPQLAHSEEIRTALKKFRAAGKFSYAFSTGYGGYGPGNRAYYLASAFEKVWLQPIGQLGLAGLRLEQPFARAALEKVGVKAQFMQREEYKSAMSLVTDDMMSVPMREMMQSILDATNAQLAEGIAAGRNLPVDGVRELIAKGPYTAQEALDKKLIDKIGYIDEIEKILNDSFGKETAKMRPDIYAALPPSKAPQEMKATVAMVFATGEIKETTSQGGAIPGSDAMDSREVATALFKASEDKEVQMIILRVDSPGGSPTASETIRRAVVNAQAKGKKVIVSMGTMAGSGGYWIAMNGDRIFADAATLTGSIGVLGGKLVLAGLFEKLGVNWEVLGDGVYPGMWSFLRDNTPEEQARADALIDDTYNAFRTNVSAARKIPMDKIGTVSKGRIFTGSQALKIGLVDEIGGMRAALDYAARNLGAASTEQLRIKPFPEPETMEDMVRSMMKQLMRPGMDIPDISIVMTQIGRWLAATQAAPQVRMPGLQIQ
ncbi:MAG: signal peptide peptidase SppA [Alphaproteobacteria bacterium]